jgi:hypothetical protein
MDVVGLEHLDANRNQIEHLTGAGEHVINRVTTGQAHVRRLACIGKIVTETVYRGAESHLTILQ